MNVFGWALLFNFHFLCWDPSAEKMTFLQEINTDTLRWSPAYRLKFEDFKGDDNSATIQYDTANYTKLGFSTVYIDYTPKYENQKFMIEACAVFVKNKSWLKRKDERVLKHEQGHFDIAELYARKFEDRMADVKPADFTSRLGVVLQEIQTELQEAQSRYDLVTSNSTIQENYYKWLEAELKQKQ